MARSMLSARIATSSTRRAVVYLSAATSQMRMVYTQTMAMSSAFAMALMYRYLSTKKDTPCHLLLCRRERLE